MTPDEQVWLSQMIAALRDERLSDDDAARLEQILQSSPAAQQAYVDHMALEGLLQWEFGNVVRTQIEPLLAPQSSPSIGTRPALQPRRFALRPLAAGLLVGILSTSLVWAISAAADRPPPPLIWPLVDGGFESGNQTESNGVPHSAGVWDGDFATVVGAEQGLTPRSGSQMLRLLRSDFQGERSPISYVGNIVQIVDLRSRQAEFADGRAAAELTAWFDAVPAQPEERYFAGLHLFAMAGDPASPHPADTSWLMENCLASGGVQHVSLDVTPGWQQVATSVSIPVGCDYLVVMLKVARLQPAPGAEPVIFPGHYVDDVSLTLKR